MLTHLQQKRREAISGLTNVIHRSQRYQYDIRDVRVGGYLSYKGENFKVIKMSKYLDVKWSNFKRRKKDYFITELELFSLKSGQKVYMEYEYDDELEISLTQKELKLRDLSSFGKKVTKELLEQIAQEEEGEVLYQGVTYFYEEDYTWAGLYFKDDKDEMGVPVRFYEFESQDAEALTIEIWYGQSEDERVSREAFLSSEISTGVEILQLQG